MSHAHPVQPFPLSLVPAPAMFDRAARKLVPWLSVAGVLLMLAAAAIAMAGHDVSAGAGAERILLIHVPAAWLSLLLYFCMAGSAAVALLGRAQLPRLLVAAMAPTGLVFTLMALWTGAVWGRPVIAPWDARLVCEAILLVLYLAVLALPGFTADPRSAEASCAALLVVGALNIPLIYFSVSWWNELHPAGGAAATSAASASPALGFGMAVMTLAFAAYAGAVVLTRARRLLREQRAAARSSGAKATA